MESRSANSERLSIAVIIATLGRAPIVGQIDQLLAAQTRPADLVVYSVVSKDDLPEGFAEGERRKIVFGPKGACAQRNSGIAAAGEGYDIIVFYDDDFIPAANSLEGIERFFRNHPDVVGATGDVIADGINTPGISLEEGLALIAAHPSIKGTSDTIIGRRNGLYGCNMAYRRSVIGETRFDERLRLYAWQEDIDFSASLLDRGRLVKTLAFAGVHQGVKMGRTPGIRFGYSQVINPAYLYKKGTMRLGFALKSIGRNFVSNHVKMFNPEPWVDRKGRVKGNWLGMLDLVRGRLTPERVEQL